MYTNLCFERYNINDVLMLCLFVILINSEADFDSLISVGIVFQVLMARNLKLHIPKFVKLDNTE